MHATSLEFLEVLKYIFIILPLGSCWSINVLKIKTCIHLEVLVGTIGSLEYLYYMYVHQEQG